MSEDLRVVVSALAAIPAGWLSLVFVDRIPDALPLFRPFPRFPLPRGLWRADGLVYLLTAATFVLAGLRFDEGPYLIAYLALFTVLIALSVIDMYTLRLPDRLVIPSIAVSLVMLAGAAIADGSTEQLTGALTGAFAYFGVLLLAHLVYPPGMGFGDVKLAFLMGLFLGWPAPGAVEALVLVLWAMLLGFGLGSVIGIAILVVRGRSAPYPFGPFLALGAALVMLATPGLLPASADIRF